MFSTISVFWSNCLMVLGLLVLTAILFLMAFACIDYLLSQSLRLRVRQMRYQFWCHRACKHYAKVVPPPDKVELISSDKLLHATIRDALQFARREGLTVRLRHVPLKPLAMGRFCQDIEIDRSLASIRAQDAEAAATAAKAESWLTTRHKIHPDSI